MIKPLPDETPKAFQAFITYLDLGYNRSLQEVANMLYPREDGEDSGSVRWVHEWNKRYNWQQRILDIETQEAQDRARRFQHMRDQLLVEGLEDYLKQLQKWRELWQRTDMFLKDGRTTQVNDDNSVTTIYTVGLNIDDYRKLADLRMVIEKQGRLALGMPDRITQEDVWENKQVQITVRYEDE